MPQAANIVLTDALAGSQTFEPTNIARNGDAHFYNFVDGQPNLNDHLMLSANRTNTSTTKSVIKLETIKSIVDANSGESIPSGKAIMELTVKMPTHFTQADRDDAYAQFESALADPLVLSVVKDGRAAY